MSSPCLAFLGLPGGGEWVVILAIAVLLFGRRLPEIARAIGKSLAEFKKGLKEAEAELQAPPKPSEPPDASRPPAEKESAQPGGGDEK